MAASASASFPDKVSLRQALWDQIEARAAELIELCRELIRVPSVNGVHPEEGVARVIAGALAARGVQPDMPSYEAGRPNVTAEVGRGERALILVGHMDTVPEGDPALWSAPPFAAELRDGRIIGRGACDNKAGIAVGILLLATLRECVPQMPGRVMLVCVPDEESGATGRIGITPLLREGRIPRGQAVYTYPGLDVLSIGHRGLLRVRVSAFGEATHTGGDAWESGTGGVNAVTALADYLLSLERWQPAFDPHPAFPGRRPVITPGTLIKGGEIESMVPARAEAIVDVRLLPGQQGDALLAEMQGLVAPILDRRPGVRFEWEKRIDLPAVAIPADAPIVRVLTHWTEVVTGTPPVAVGAGPANEGYLLIEAGIPTICGFGPPGGNAHAVDEYVEAGGLVPAAKIYAAAALDLLLPEAGSLAVGAS